MPVVTRAVPERLAHQPALDGLRAVAVLAVLVYHQDFSQGWGRGGFLGVDAFFVLSGFLITSLLLIDHAHTGRVVSWQFWARRARRLLPALLVLLLIAAAYAAFVAKPYDLGVLRSNAIATLFYVNNFWQMSAVHRGGPLVLNHTWSLSIEEQFYLVWPLALALMVRATRGRTAWMVAVLGAFAAVSVGYMALLYKPSNPWPAYLSTGSRAHSLLVGAALGMLLLGWSGPARRGARVALEAAGVVALAALLLMMAVVAFDGSSWLYHGGYLLVALLSATVIAAAVQSHSPVVRRVLSIRPLVAVGIISYGLYLYHLPIYAWLTPERVGVSGVPLFMVRIAVTFAVAIASYFLVERPIRRGSLSWPQLRVLAPAATLAVVVLVLVATVGSEPTPASALTTLFYNQLASSAPSGAVRVLVAGDSIAYGLGTSVGGSFTRDGIAGATVGVPGCGIGTGSVLNGATARPEPACAVWPDDYQNAFDSFKPAVSVLMVGTTEVRDRVVDGHTLRVGTPEFATYLRGQLDQAAKILTAHGTPLVLLTAPCLFAPNAPATAGQGYPRRLAEVNSIFRQFAAAHPASVRIGDYAGYMCPDGVPRASVGGKPARNATSRLLTKAGAIATWQWLARTPLIEQQVRAKH